MRYINVRLLLLLLQMDGHRATTNDRAYAQRRAVKIVQQLLSLLLIFSQQVSLAIVLIISVLGHKHNHDNLSWFVTNFRAYFSAGT